MAAFRVKVAGEDRPRRSDPPAAAPGLASAGVATCPHCGHRFALFAHAPTAPRRFKVGG